MTGQYFLTACSLIIALIVAIVAVQQLLLSRQRFKLDLFEKRYNVYKATQDFLENIRTDYKVEMDDIIKFRASTQDSVFLFQEDIPNYLKKIYNKAFKLWEIHESLKVVPNGKRRSKMCYEQTDLFDWL